MKIIHGEAKAEIHKLKKESIDCIVTSPPYWALRDYGSKSQLGLESTLGEYISKLCDVFDAVKRVMKPTGTCFVNIGDTYFGGGRNRGNSKPHPKGVRGLTNLGDAVPGPKGQSKSLAQIPSRFAIEMANRGWILRNEIIWHKPNCMPASVRDRFTVDFEKIFFFVKNKKYYFEQQLEPYTAPMNRWGGEKLKADKKSQWDKGTGQETYRERNMRPNQKGRNKRSVWKIPTKPFSGAHFATFPEALIRPMIIAGCPQGGVVLDPFAGAGTTVIVAEQENRNGIGIELNAEYIKIAQKRFDNLNKKMF